MDNKNFYENFDWKRAKLSEKIKEKLEIIFGTIPNDVESILDVGCGDGTISNELARKFEVTAVDRSHNALKNVRTRKVQASADALPFPDASFDLVFSSELIEHLPDGVFEKTLNEIKRLAKKYVLLTFPNNENIEKYLVKCPNCGYVFNRTYHLQSINRGRIEKMFPEFKIVASFETGARIRDYNRALNKIKHKFAPAESWIPLYWTRKFHRDAMCPKCEYSFEIPYKFNLIARACDAINILISPKRKYQLGLLLERK